MGLAEQKVKVPHVHCDSRVQTVCADVMNLPKNKLKALSPKVTGHIKNRKFLIVVLFIPMSLT